MTPLSNFVNPQSLHRSLAHSNVARLAMGQPSDSWEMELEHELAYKIDEGRYLEKLRAQVAPMVRSYADTNDFISWFEALVDSGPGQNHPLFDWLAHEATLPQMRWFLTQEAAGEAGFDDLIAYTQVKLPAQAKLECARNYWDEMGRGKQGAMHGKMLERMVLELDLQPQIDTTVWESLALANTMLGLATTRRYVYHSIGALGVIELTAPQRVKKISLGMQRLGMNGRTRAYFDLHATLDISHAQAWIAEIVKPLVEADPNCAKYIAEGALMRLVCGERCFNRYVQQFQGGDLDYPLHLRQPEWCDSTAIGPLR